jgi:AcrR family transcriptional regulator
VPSKQQVVAQFRSSEILAAARKVFSIRGFRDTTVDEVAAAAGLAKATVYTYFSSKQDIYLAALSEGVRKMVECIEEKMQAAPDDIRSKVEAYIRTRLEFLCENRDFFKVYHAEFGNLIHPASLNIEFRNLYRRQFDRLKGLLEEAVEKGEIVGISPETLATMIYESARGLTLRRNLGWTTATIDEQVETLMRILWDGVEVRCVDR